jgi:hypothetical protein
MEAKDQLRSNMAKYYLERRAAATATSLRAKSRTINWISLIAAELGFGGDKGNPNLTA